MTSRKIYIRVRTGSSSGSRSDAKWSEMNVDTTTLQYDIKIGMLTRKYKFML